jgi:hypothetical protein
MDKALLVDANVEQATMLIKLLDETELDVHSALWMYYPEKEQWKLIIATPMIEQKGPQKAYTVVQKILADHRELSGLSLQDIALVSDKNSRLIHTLRNMIQTGKTINNIRFSKNVINGEYFDDAIILRLQ